MPITRNADYLGQARSRYPAQYQGKPRFDAIVQAFSAEAQALENSMLDVYTQRLLSSGPAQIVGRASFSNTDTATLYWPWPFANTSYLMLPGKAVITDGGAIPIVGVDNTSKTTTSVTVKASAAFTGYVSVLAWNPGENPLQRGVGGDLLDKIGKIVGQPRNGMTDSQYLVLITARVAANKSDGRRETLIRLARLLVPGASIYVKDFPPCSVYVFPQAPITIDPYVAARFMEDAATAGVNLVLAWTTVSLANTFVVGSIYSSGFSAGPSVSNSGVTSQQSPGSIYASGFSAGPSVTSDGGATVPGAIQSQG